ncbi:hypothetical protein BT69DRAFT_145042 [Atractiella rhizophila]|nr:hypothetical protein BT69DRAFT_145042 [Atractiella rhizophila]
MNFEQLQCRMSYVLNGKSNFNYANEIYNWLPIVYSLYLRLSYPFLPPSFRTNSLNQMFAPTDLYAFHLSSRFVPSVLSLLPLIPLSFFTWLHVLYSLVLRFRSKGRDAHRKTYGRRFYATAGALIAIAWWAEHNIGGKAGEATVSLGMREGLKVIILPLLLQRIPSRTCYPSPAPSTTFASSFLLPIPIVLFSYFSASVCSHSLADTFLYFLLTALPAFEFVVLAREHQDSVQNEDERRGWFHFLLNVSPYALLSYLCFSMPHLLPLLFNTTPNSFRTSLPTYLFFPPTYQNYYLIHIPSLHTVDLFSSFAICNMLLLLGMDGLVSWKGWLGGGKGMETDDTKVWVISGALCLVMVLTLEKPWYRSTRLEKQEVLVPLHIMGQEEEEELDTRAAIHPPLSRVLVTLFPLALLLLTSPIFPQKPKEIDIVISYYEEVSDFLRDYRLSERQRGARLAG